MKHAQDWKPSKFVVRRGRLRGSRDPREIAVESRLIADLVAHVFERHLPEHCAGRLLDMGCGKVPLYGTYRHCVTEVVCVDWAHSESPSPHLDLSYDLSRPLPFEDGAFDTVLATDVLEHMVDPRQTMSEIARLLSSGGKLLASVPFCYWLHEEPHDYYRFTEHALRDFVSAAGLDLVLLECVGGAPVVIADILAKYTVRAPVVGRPASAAVQRAFSMVTRHRRLARLAASTDRLWPLSYFLVCSKP
jgi:SAM-dependent methyltransferase